MAQVSTGSIFADTVTPVSVGVGASVNQKYKWGKKCTLGVLSGVRYEVVIIVNLSGCRAHACLQEVLLFTTANRMSRLTAVHTSPTVMSTIEVRMYIIA